MKKILFSIFSFISLYSFGQSVLISPSTIEKQNSSLDDIKSTSYDKSPSITGLRVNGTVAAKTPILLGDELMQIAAKGYDGFSFNYSGGKIKFKATQNWRSTNGGAISFETTNNNGTIPVERMIINHDGYVGVGLSSPNQILDVNGRMRIRHTVIGGSHYTSGIWMSNSTNGLTDSDGAFYGMKNDTQTGIWINNAWRFWVNNDGNATITGLAGTGNRAVYADANGTLSVAAQTKTLVVPPQSFQRRYNSGEGTYIHTGMYLNSFLIFSYDELTASFTLPVGATLVSISVYFTDNDDNNNLGFTFFKSSLTSAGVINSSDLFQNTNNANPFDITTLSTSTLNWSVGADDYFTILVKPTLLNLASNGVWDNNSLGSTTSIKGVKVTYTL